MHNLFPNIIFYSYNRMLGNIMIKKYIMAEKLEISYYFCQNILNINKNTY